MLFSPLKLSFLIGQRVGGNWDGYWLTESLIPDGEGLPSGIAY